MTWIERGGWARHELAGFFRNLGIRESKFFPKFHGRVGLRASGISFQLKQFLDFELWSEEASGKIFPILDFWGRREGEASRALCWRGGFEICWPAVSEVWDGEKKRTRGVT